MFAGIIRSFLGGQWQKAGSHGQGQGYVYKGGKSSRMLFSFFTYLSLMGRLARMGLHIELNQCRKYPCTVVAARDYAQRTAFSERDSYA